MSIVMKVWEWLLYTAAAAYLGWIAYVLIVLY